MQEEGAPPNKPGGDRPTWFDLSAGDSETLVEGDKPVDVAEQQNCPKGDDGAGGCTTSETPVLDRATLQQKIKRCKRVISLLAKEGCEEGDEAFDGAQRDLAQLTAQLGSKDEVGGQPTGSALDRAEKQLKKANAAREALDQERAEMEAEYQRNLEKLNSKYEQVDARIQLHTKKIRDIKAAFGGGNKVPRQVERNVAAAKDILAALGPSIAGALALLKPDPRCQDNQGTLDNIGEQLGKVYDHLLTTTRAIEDATVEDTSEEDSSDFDDDLEDDDDCDEMEDTPQGQLDGDTPEGGQPEAQGSGAWSSGQDIAPNVTEHPPTPLQPPSAAGGTCTPLPATPMEQGTMATGSSAAAEVGGKPGDGPAAKKPKVPHYKLNPTGKSVIKDGKGKNGTRKPGTVGGATAPMLAAMQDTPNAAQDGNCTSGAIDGDDC